MLFGPTVYKTNTLSLRGSSLPWLMKQLVDTSLQGKASITRLDLVDEVKGFCRLPSIEQSVHKRLQAKTKRQTKVSQKHQPA